MENSIENRVVKIETVRMPNGDEVSFCRERGGIITSIKFKGKEILYLDEATLQDPKVNVKGGIPILFPNAGPLSNGLYHLPQHGFARRMPWNVTELNRSSVTLQLLSNTETREVYPFNFKLELKVEVAENILTHSLTINNTGDQPMPTAYGTHPYFNISQEDKPGLITNIDGFHPQAINWLAEFDKPFPNPGLINIRMPGKEITIDTAPDIFKITRIWHQPGQDFICIEPWTRDSFALDHPGQSLWIGPHKSITLTLTISDKIT